MRKLLSCLILSLTLFALTALFNVGRVSAASSAELINLINQYRSSKGLPTLTADQKLKNAACWMASDMANKGYFSHTDSLGRDPFARMAVFGVSGGSRAENIASLTNQANSASKIFTGWKNSSGHNKNMLGSSYTRIGVGYAYRASNKTYYWVADFASGTRVAAGTECGSTAAPKPPAPKPNPPTPTSQPVAAAPTTKTATKNSSVNVKINSTNNTTSKQVLAEEKSEASDKVAWSVYEPKLVKEESSAVLTKESHNDQVVLFLFLVANILLLGKTSFALLKAHHN